MKTRGKKTKKIKRTKKKHHDGTYIKKIKHKGNKTNKKTKRK
jgi:hypothetical protein